MIFAFYTVAALLVLALAGAALTRVDPVRLANGLRIAGPLLLAVAGAVMLVVGRAGIGGALLSAAFAWYSWMRRSATVRRSPGRRSTVRTAALEMELDHDSGALEGVVLAGRFESRVIGELTRDELIALRTELSSDGESLRLLETYLDGRFPAWREHAQADGGDRQGSSPGSGAMTKEEAYKVLGLEAGASTADVRKAHRRLMQRLHPDLGGSSFLATRINEAKDVLLSKHH